MTTQDIIHAISEMNSKDDLEAIQHAAGSRSRHLRFNDHEDLKVCILSLREHLPLGMSRQVVRCMQSLDPSFDWELSEHYSDEYDMCEIFHEKIHQRIQELDDFMHDAYHIIFDYDLAVLDKTLNALDQHIVEVKKMKLLGVC